jgi:hypothetical protein
MIAFYFENALAYYNIGVVAVNFQVVGLTSRVNIMMRFFAISPTNVVKKALK